MAAGAMEHALKGGTITTGRIFSFDSTNFIRFPGRPPAELHLIFDTLLVSRDSPGVYHGLLAKDMKVSSDFSEVSFVIDSSARWHDDTAVTAEDVVFTFDTLAKFGGPAFGPMLKTVEVKLVDASTVSFRRPNAETWNWIGQIGTFPIQSKAFWQTRDPSKQSLDPPLGSGPYRVANIDLDRVFSLERATSYWAADHPVNRGLYNFDRIELELFYDHAVMREALKRGDLDVMREFFPAAWREGYDSPALRKGKLVKSAVPRQDAGALVTLTMNLRRAPFTDRRVREALVLAFDEAFYNKIQGDLYGLPGSFYGNTRLAARGVAQALERRLLEPFLASLPDGIMDAPAPGGKNWPMRQRLRTAGKLLDAAGFPVRDGVRVNAETGEPLILSLVTHPTLANRLVPYAQGLKRLGVTLEINVVNIATLRQLLNDHDFDLTWVTVAYDDPPGRRERTHWHSSMKAAGTYGFAGLSSPVADSLLDTMRTSLDEAEIVAAARAFDRFLRWGLYVIPMWHEDEIWLAYNADLGVGDLNATAENPLTRWFWKELAD